MGAETDAPVRTPEVPRESGNRKRRIRKAVWWLNPFHVGAWVFGRLADSILRRFMPGDGKWMAVGRVIVAVLFVWFFIEIAVVPALAVCALFAAQAVLGHWPEWLVLAALVWFSVRIVSEGVWRLWIPAVERPKEDAATTIMMAYLCLVLLTITFTVLTAILVAHGWLGTPAPHGRGRLVWDALGYYTWNFLDGIPILHIPKTLNWKLGPGFKDHASGALLLLYKLLVILPVIGLIVALTKSRDKQRLAPQGGA
jgi:hypothetical protein